MNWTPSDPGQGNPDGIDALAARLGGVVETASCAQANLQRLKDHATDAVWRGPAAEAFRHRIDKLPAHLARLAASYADARDGFNTYAAEIRDLQHRQRTIQHEITAAESDHSAATVAHDAAAAVSTAPTTNPYEAAIAAAQARLTAATSKLHDLAEDRAGADARAMGSLKAAHQAGMKNKSGWNYFWHGLSTALAVVAVVLLVIAVIAVIIAFPAALAAFAAAEGLLSSLTAAAAVLGAAAGGGTLGLAITGVGIASLGTETVLYTEGEGSGKRLALDTALTLSPLTLARGTRYLAETAAALRTATQASEIPRTFTSTDPLVADLAKAIEEALPGRIVDINSMVPMFDGYEREIDINLGDIYLQVKSDAARGLFGQLQKTVQSTGVPAVGYAPTMPMAAWAHAAREGVPIARDLPELFAILKELT